MPLQAVRDSILEMTGRYDLATPGGADNGLNAIINKAQRFLDMETHFHWSPKEFSIDIEADTYYVSVPGLRVINRAFFSNAEDEVTGIEILKSHAEMRSIYGDIFAAVDSGTPLYGYINTVRPGSYLTNLAQDAYEENASIESSPVIKRPTSADTSQFVFLPPTDEAITIHLEGLFYTLDLVEDDDISVWTEVHSRALELTTCMMLEQNLRNSEGAKDYQLALQGYVWSMRNDMVHHMMASNPDSVMRG